MPAARAGVGGSHQGDFAGKRAAQAGSTDPKNSFLQWLTQLIEDGSWKFSEFIQKQHASMGQAEFTGPRIETTAEKPCCGCAVVRRTKGPLSNQACHAAEGASDRLKAGEFQCLGVAQRRKNHGELPRQHRFATARRPNHQEMVATGGCNRQSLSGEMLNRERGCGSRVWCAGRLRCRCPFFSAGLSAMVGLDAMPELLNELPQRLGAHDGESRNQRGFRRVRRGHDKRLGVLHLCLASHGQNAPARPQASIQTQFSCTTQPLQFLGIKLAASDQQSQRDGQVEGRPLLTSISGSQIDDDPDEGTAKAAVAKRRPNAFTGFLNGRIGKAHKLQAWQPWR